MLCRNMQKFRVYNLKIFEMCTIRFFFNFLDVGPSRRYTGISKCYFLLSVAALEEGSASTGLSSEPTVAEPTQVKRAVGRPRKRPRNLEDSKLKLF